MFGVDLKGRVKNITLPITKSLLPVFEAVVNSLQSIEDLEDKTNRYIKITLERNTTQQNINNQEDGNFYPIENVIIEDNGVGFNDDNYKSFLTSDSLYKVSKGGKGVGRLLWLKAFEKAEIESTYKENDLFYNRNFTFNLDGEYIHDKYEFISERKNRYTRIKLINLKKPYFESHIKNLETIAIRIIEHCISFFLLQNCPRIILCDGFTEINLNTLFNETIKVNTYRDKFNIENYNFEIIHVKLFKSQESIHRIHWCANQREVLNKGLKNFIPNLYKKIQDDNGDFFIYSAFLSGEFLDENVNLERTNFNIPEMSDGSLINGITKKSINDKVIERIKLYLNKYLEPINLEKKKRIKEYINSKSPQYKMIIKHKNDMIDEIPPNLSDDKLEIELFKITQKFNYEVKENGIKILSKKSKNIKDADQYKKEYKRYVEQMNDLGKSSLAQYIVHRKVILDLLENGLMQNSDMKYNKEEFVHNLIFPMNKTSDDIGYEKHNLWLLDEKLSYHYYLASDIKMNNMDDINVDSISRPDLLIIDNPVAVVNENKPYNSIVIFEFKRPGRKAYSNEENPITQLYRYVKEIKEGNKLDKNGRPITISDNTPFYLYIICDLTKKIQEYAEISNLNKTPDNEGYFGYITVKNVNAYIEIISYDKLIEDAKKRNKILFKKLFNPQIEEEVYKIEIV